MTSVGQIGWEKLYCKKVKVYFIALEIKYSLDLSKDGKVEVIILIYFPRAGEKLNKTVTIVPHSLCLCSLFYSCVAHKTILKLCRVPKDLL